MKILYISHQKEDSGYGRSCRDYLQALKTTGAEIASYPIILGKPGNFVEETERNDIRGADVVIQHVLPHFMSYNGNYEKNIGICLNETTSTSMNYWDAHLDMMTEVWYPYGVNKNKEFTIPHPVDVDIYKRKYPKMNIPEADGTFKFYWIGEASKRKNLSALITGYFLAFKASDPVSLIIKVYKSGYTDQQVKKEIEDLIEKTAIGLKLYKIEDYPRVFVISDFWRDEQIYALHNMCDCYVTTSFGEALCYPLIDALGFNKQTIASNNVSSYYRKYGHMDIVATTKEHCYGQIDSFDGHYTAREYWKSVKMEDLIHSFQYEYNNRKVLNNNLSGLSYTNVGQIMLGRLL